MAAVPAWKQAILDKKKQKDVDEDKKRKEEEKKLAQLPAWKRSLMLRKQEDTSSGKASPPLSRSGFATKRKDSLLREGSVDNQRARSDSQTSDGGTTPVSPAGKPFTPPSSSAVSPSPDTTSTQPRSGQSQAHSTTSPVPGTLSNERERSSSVGSDDGSGDRPKANVKQLLGMFKDKSIDEPSKRPGSTERRRSGTTPPTKPSGQQQTTPTKTKPSASSLAERKQTPAKPQVKIPQSNAKSTASTDVPDGSMLMTSFIDGEEDDEVTNIDDVVLDAKMMSRIKTSPGRVAGVESEPTSPTAKKRSGSILLSPARRLSKARRSVSFDKINLEVVHTFEREPNSDEEEEEEEQDVPDRGPRAQSGLRSVPSIGAKRDGDQPSGFQAFTPKALSDTVAEEKPSAAADVAIPSWRQAAPATKKKEEKKEEEPLNIAQQSDMVVEDMEDQPALLW